MKKPRQNDCCGEHRVRNLSRGNHDSLTPFYSIRARHCQLSRSVLWNAPSSVHRGLRNTKDRKSLPGDDRGLFWDVSPLARFDCYKAWPVSFSARSFNAALRESFTRPLSSMPMHLTQIMSPLLTTSSVRFTRKSARSEMCTKPSLPGKTSTNAPNSFVVTTRP